MKKFKKVIALVIALSATFAFAGCTKKEVPPEPNTTPEATSPEASTDGTTYLIATDTTFAPFEFEDASGKFVGIDMEILEAIAADQGFKYELQVLGFNAAVQSLKAKQSDAVIAGMSITDERKEAFDFSEPYFDSGVVMGIASDNTEITKYEDLKGKKVAIKTGTEGATFAESIKDKYGFDVTYFDDSASLYEDVKLGNTVACFEDYPVLGYAISQNVGLTIVTEKEAGSSYGFAVAKGQDPELIDMFNKGLANIKVSGKYQEILDKYIQE